MKKQSILRVFCVLLALVLAAPLLPAAAAEETGKSKVYVNMYSDEKMTKTEKEYLTSNADPDTPLNVDTFGKYITVGKKVYEYKGVWNGVRVVSSARSVPGQEYIMVYVPHSHAFRKYYTRWLHWETCPCGKTQGKGDHVDPASDEDGVCTCGYRFSTNTDLTVLWLANVQLEERFRRDVTEYRGSTVTYMDVPATSITALALDSLATVRLPESLELEKGLNKLEITVTAEDGRTTKTYTVWVSRSVTVDGAVISALALEDGSAAQAALKVTPRQDYSSLPKVRLTASGGLSPEAGEALLEMARNMEAREVRLALEYNPWAVDTVLATVPVSWLLELAEAEMDLVLTCHLGSMRMTHGEMAEFEEEEGLEEITLTLHQAKTLEGTASRDVQVEVIPPETEE